MPAGLNRPGVLEPGDLVALVAPSRPASERGTREAAAYLEQLGYRVEISPSIHDRHYYLAGTDETRAAELNRVFAAPEIRAVFCARGGFGSGRLLDRLEYDAVRSDPKVVAGFSDSTALLLALYSRARLAVFNGALADFDLGKRRDPLVEASLWPLVTSPEPLGEVPEAAESMGVVRPGTARGPLVPANLALLCSLLGTPFFPPLDGALLVLEDIEEYPYRIDRMLNQLRLAGVFERLGGLLFGQFRDCFTAEEMEEAPTLAELALEHTRGTDFPIVAGLPFSHFARRLVLPVGVRAELDTSVPSLKITEAAVVNPAGCSRGISAGTPSIPLK